MRQRIGRRPDVAYLVHRTRIHVHAVVSLYALLAEVDRGCGPVGVGVVDGNEDDILGEDIDLDVGLVEPHGRSKDI